MNKSKAKGTYFETRVRKYLEDGGLEVKRLAIGGMNDEGDLSFLDVAAECKNVTNLAIPNWVRQAEKEQKNAKKKWWSLIVNRKNHELGQAYVVISLEYYRDLITSKSIDDTIEL